MFAVLVAVLAVAAVAVLWRLQARPLSLRSLLPKAEKRISQVIEPYSVRLQDMVITYAGWRDPLQVRAVDVQVLDRSGNEVVKLPHADVDLSLAGLAHGDFVVKRIKATGLVVRLVRFEDGRVGFHDDPEGQRRASSKGHADVATLLKSWVGPTADANHPRVRLRKFHLADAELSLDDRILGIVWQAQAVDLVLDHRGDGLRGRLSLTAGQGDLHVGVSGSAEWRPDPNRIEVQVDVSDFRPTLVAPLIPGLPMLGDIDLPVDATFRGTFEGGFRPTKAELDLRSARGNITADVKPGAAAGEYAAEATLDELKIWPFADEIPELEPLARVHLPISGKLTLLADVNNRKLLEGSLDLQSDRGNVTAHVKPGPAAGDLTAEIGIEDLRVWPFADEVEALAPLAGVRLPLSGSIDVAANLDTVELQHASFDLATTAGTIHMAAIGPTPYPVRSIALRGKMSGLERLVVENLQIALDDVVTVRSHGSLQRAQGALAIDVSAALDSLPVDRLPSLWPEAAVPGTRSWIVSNIPHGTINALEAHVAIRADADGVVLDDLDGEFSLADLQLVLLGPERAVEGIGGTAKVDTDGFHFKVKEARLGAIAVTDGTVALSGIFDGAARADIEIQCSTPLGSAAELIVSKPIAVVSRSILSPDNLGGNANATVNIGLPLSGSRTIEVGVDAELDEASWTDNPIGADITHGDLELSFHGDDVHVSGSADLKGVAMKVDYHGLLGEGEVRRRATAEAHLSDHDLRALGVPDQPYVAGPIILAATMVQNRDGLLQATGDLDLGEARLAVSELGWEKAAGKPAQGKLEITVRPDTATWSMDNLVLDGEGLAVQASLHGPTKPMGIEKVGVDRLELGQTSIAGTVEIDPSGHLKITLKGDRLHIGGLVDGLKTDAAGAKAHQARGNTGSRSLPDLVLQASIGELHLGGQASLGRLELQAETSAAGVRRLDLRFGGGEAPSKVLLAPLDGGGKRLQAHVDDVGRVLTRLALSSQLTGGQLDLTVERSSPDTPMRGEILVKDLHVVEAPVFARVLKLSTFKGLLETFSTSGLDVNQLRGDLEYTGDQLRISDLRIHGDGFGVTGELETTFNPVHLGATGYLAPLSTLQRFLGKIPLLGKILTGTHEEGFIATEFRVQGPISDLEVKVHPLSVLTPGILHDLTRLKPDHDTN